MTILKEMKNEEKKNPAMSTKRDCIVAKIWPIL